MAKPPPTELKFELAGIATITLALLGLVSLLTPTAGTAGSLLRQGLVSIAGAGRYLLPLFFLFIGWEIIRQRRNLQFTSRLTGLTLLLLAALTFLHLGVPLTETFSAGKQGQGGGLLGALGSYLLIKYFGLAGSYIILTSLLIVAVILFTGLSLAQLGQIFGTRLSLAGQKTVHRISNFLFEEIEAEEEESEGGQKDKGAGKKVIIANRPEAAAERDKERYPAKKQQDETDQNKKDSKVIPFSVRSGKTCQLPPASLLSPAKGRESGVTDKEINEKIGILEETLASFGIPARVTQVTVGPAITRYEIQPPAGVKVSRIVGLADDLALALAAPQVRIEAPIPGRAAIGIEVPNRKTATVHLRELLESKEFQQSPSRLTVALGKDIAGAPVVADLAQMPHLLVAGATGSGKSVCINTIVASILFKATPDEVKFILIDPKMVELITYNGIPHLITPVVTSPKKAAGILHWAVKEMERRYELFAAAGAKDIARYNELYAGQPRSPVSGSANGAGEPGTAGEKGVTGGGAGEKNANDGGVGDGPLPFIVIIIDELADLMMVAPAEVEDSICRLAQMARAAGLHLVVATQRPSVDIITGLIKANIPSRISFAVSSQMDSRTILDIGGAEKLLGRGDMLFFPVGAPKPVRVQGTFLSDKEVEALVAFLKEQAKPVYDQEVA
ncbi:MAG: DNA translocase FtsK, partial [Bacillota bacterium]